MSLPQPRMTALRAENDLHATQHKTHLRLGKLLALKLPAYKDCHIWFTCLRSFWSHMLECTTAIPKVTVVETRAVL